MSRLDALERILVGVVYMPLYYFVLYPIAFAFGIVVTAIALAWQLATGRELSTKPEWAAGLWDAVSQPVSWIFSGDDRSKPGWLP